MKKVVKKIILTTLIALCILFALVHIYFEILHVNLLIPDLAVSVLYSYALIALGLAIICIYLIKLRKGNVKRE